MVWMTIEIEDYSDCLIEFLSEKNHYQFNFVAFAEVLISIIEI